MLARPRPLALAVLLATMTATAAHAQPAPTVEEFAWLGWPDAVQSVSSVEVNDLGQVALTAATEVFTQRAFYLLGDEWGAIPAYQNGVGGINRDGWVAGWMTNSTSGPVWAFTWDPVTGLFVLDSGLPEFTTATRASDINDAGEFVGRVFIEQGDATTVWPFRHTADGLDVLYGTVQNGEPMAVNDTGTMIVRVSDGGANVLSQITGDNTVIPMPTPPWDLANPKDINDSGWFVGDAETSDFSVDQAFLWNGQEYVQLPLPAGFTSADAEAINDIAQIAGWGWNGGFRALVWQDGAGFDLGALVTDDLGIPADLKKAFSITDDGWVAGWGQGPSGGPEIFRARLGPPCPDPGTGEGMIGWTGAAGSYQDPDNWAGGEVPASDQIVRIGGEPDAEVSLGGDAINQSLVLVSSTGGALIEANGHTWTLQGNDPCLPGLLTHQEDGELALFDLIGGALDIGGGVSLEHGGSSALSVYGGQQWTVTGGPLLAGHPDTTEFAFSDGAVVDVAQEVVLGLRTGERADGALRDGGLTAGEVILGSRGSGILTLTDATFQPDGLVLGELTGGFGRLVAGGEVGNILTTGQFIVGEAGTGELDLTNTTASVDALEIASLADGDGLALVWQGAWLGASAVTVGNAGTGALDVLAGGEVVQSGGSSLAVAAAAGSAGDLLVSGAGSRVACEALTVGEAGDGVVSVESEARLDVAQSILLGDQPGGHGDLLVSGSQVTAAALYVGNPEGGTGAVITDSLSVVIVGVLEVTSNGALLGPIIELGAPGGKAAATGTGGALRTDVLRLATGASVDVDTVQFGTGWTLGGSGLFPFDVVNTATVDPGDSLAAGTFTIDGDYTQTPAGRLRIDVFGPGPVRRVGIADALGASGQAALAGTLAVHLAPDAAPEEGDRHRILTAGAITGTFDAIELPLEIEADLIPGDGWLDLQITRVTSPVHLPRVTGHRDGRTVVLGWEPAPGTGADRYVIRHRGPHAANGARGGGGAAASWRVLAEVVAQGHAPHTHRAAGLLGGAHAFRVEQWADGALVAVSAAVSVELPPGPPFALSPVAPNPFNPRAAFSLSVARAQHVRVRVVDLRGREVAVIHDGPLGAGSPHHLVLDGRDWASGAYLVHVEGEDFTTGRKVMLLE